MGTDAHYPRRHIRPASQARADHGVRQPRFDRGDLLEGAPERFQVHPCPTGGFGCRDRRRLRTGNPVARPCQCAYVRGDLEHDEQHHDRGDEPHPAHRDRGKPDTRDAPDGTVADERRTRNADEAVGEVELSARSGCGRTRGIHARLRDRHAATGRPGIPLDPAGRLGPTCGEHARGSLGGDADRTGPGTNRRLRPLLVQREEPGAHLRILDRPRGWLGTSGDSCREARRTRLGCAVLGAATVPRAPPPVPGWAAVRHRPACRPPGRPRRRDRHRRTRVPLLPVRRGGSTCPRG